MKHQILNGFKWDLFGKLGNQIIGFLITILLARILNPSDYGLLAMVVAISSFVNGFINLGFTSALIQKSKISDIEVSSVFTLNICLGLLLSFIFFVSSGLISNFYEIPELKEIAQVMSLSFFINSFGLVGLALLAKKLDFKSTMIINLVSGITSGLFGLILAYNNFEVWSLVYSSLLNEAIRSCLALHKSKQKLRFKISFPSLKPLFNYGSKLFISGLMNSISNQIDYLIIGKFFSPNILGIFYRAKSFRTLIIRFFSESLGKVLFPAFSLKQNDKKWIASTIKNSIIIVIQCITLLNTLLILNSYEIFSILFTDKWLGSVKYFEVFMLSSIFIPLNNICGSAINGLGHSSLFLKIDLTEKIMLMLAVVSALVTENLILYLYIDGLIRFTMLLIYLSSTKSLIIVDIKYIIKIGIRYFIICFVSLYICKYIKQDLTSFWNSDILTAIIQTILFLLVFSVSIFLENKLLSTSNYKESKSILNFIKNER